MQAFATNLATAPAASSTPVRITTTLYDLVEAISAEVGPDEDHLVTAAVMHLINSSRARFVGSRKTLTVVNAEAAYALSGAHVRERGDGMLWQL